MIRLFLLIFLGLPGLLLAQEEPRAGVDGFAGGAYRLSDWPQDPVRPHARARAQLEGWVNITRDGCVKVRGRVNTGDEFNSDWGNLGLGNEDVDFAVSLRHLYVSASCLKDVTLEAGAVPVRFAGNLGPYKKGQVDGLNIIVVDEENDREWLMTVGRLEEVSHLLDREGKINFASLQVKQGIGENGSAFVNVSRFEEFTINRAGLSWALSQYQRWLEDAGAEAIFSGTRLVGGMAHASFAHREWKARLSIAQINFNASERDRVAFQLRNFYGHGRNIFFEVSRNISRGIEVNGRVRLGEAGSQFQVGVTGKLFRNKNKKKGRN